jgi:acetylornithine deacetylase/succinyl-diaminopimelate desuccinylase-like protein
VEEIINEPTLNVHGIRSADVGKQARNVIPASATASFDIRLVKGMNPARTLDRIIQHLTKQGYFVTEKEPDMVMRREHAKIARLVRDAGYPAAKTSMDLPLARTAVAALARVHGQIVETPTLGGTLPLAAFEQALQAPFIGVPIANYDNNQHAADENIRLPNLWKGIETMAALMTMR